MTTQYTVKKGDTLSQIAQQFGFKNWELVWNDASNNELRARRKKPEQILPGDQVTIPEKTPKKEKVSAGQPAKFQMAAAPPLAAFSLTISDAQGNPFDGLDIELRMPDANTSNAFKTDKNGLIEIKDPKLKSGEVEVVSIVDKKGDPEISFKDRLPSPLAVGLAHTLKLPNKRKVADDIASTAGVARRASWGASRPKKELDPDWDYDTIVVHHSGDSGEKSAKAIQTKHFSKDFDDIAYEYVVTLEGQILEGRHLAFKSAGNSEHNTGKVAIIVAGDFEHQIWDDDDDPTQVAIDAVVKIANALKVHFPITKLAGHRDLPRAKGDTECPGTELYKFMDEMRTKTGLAGP